MSGQFGQPSAPAPFTRRFEQLAAAIERAGRRARRDRYLPCVAGGSEDEGSWPAHGRVRRRRRLSAEDRSRRSSYRRLKTRSLTGPQRRGPVAAYAPHVIFWMILFATCGYALVTGRRYERLAASAVSGGNSRFSSGASAALGWLSRNRYRRGRGRLPRLDRRRRNRARSDRFWPFWVAGLQLVASMAHILKATTGDLPPGHMHSPSVSGATRS